MLLWQGSKQFHFSHCICGCFFPLGTFLVSFTSSLVFWNFTWHALVWTFSLLCLILGGPINLESHSFSETFSSIVSSALLLQLLIVRHCIFWIHSGWLFTSSLPFFTMSLLIILIALFKYDFVSITYFNAISAFLSEDTVVLGWFSYSLKVLASLLWALSFAIETFFKFLPDH